MSKHHSSSSVVDSPVVVIHKVSFWSRLKLSIVKAFNTVMAPVKHSLGKVKDYFKKLPEVAQVAIEVAAFVAAVAFIPIVRFIVLYFLTYIAVYVVFMIIILWLFHIVGRAYNVVATA